MGNLCSRKVYPESPASPTVHPQPVVEKSVLQMDSESTDTDSETSEDSDEPTNNNHPVVERKPINPLLAKREEFERQKEAQRLRQEKLRNRECKTAAFGGGKRDIDKLERIIPIPVPPKTPSNPLNQPEFVFRT